MTQPALHYDCETTGLPVSGVPSNDPRQPLMVTLSAILDAADGTIGREYSAIVRPDGYTGTADMWNALDATKIHGITHERAMDEGVPMFEAMTAFLEMASAVDVLSSFNHFFDFKLLKISCAQIGDVGDSMRVLLETKSAICTMESAANFLIGKKRIKLKDAYFELFKEETQTGPHHLSIDDARASRRVYYELANRGGLLPAKPLTRKVYDTPYQGGEAA